MTDQHPERLAPAHRLRLQREYELAKTAGVPIRGRHCLLIVVPRPAEISKVGFIASRKGVGGAVQRNRARRRLREIVRRRWPRIQRRGYWLIFIASRGALTAGHQELATDVERLLAQAGALAPIEGGRP